MNNDIKYGRKDKGIKLELREVIDQWVATIDDSDLSNRVRKNVIVTGGSIASMKLGERVNDYDMYFRDIETTRMVAEYYMKKMAVKLGRTYGDDKDMHDVCVYVSEKENILGEKEERVINFISSSGVMSDDGNEYDLDLDEMENIPPLLNTDSGCAESKENEKEPFEPVFISENAITLSNKVQLVTRFYGEPDEIHRNYDFAHAKCYYDFWNDYLHLDNKAMNCLLERTLKYEGSLYPVASIFRMKKFLERGWRIGAGEQLKIMWQISEIDLRDKNVMREQLTGVDQAYMWSLIEALKDVDHEKINSTYVCELIDRIFD